MKDAIFAILLVVIAFIGGVAYGSGGGTLPAPSAALDGVATVLDTAADVVRPETAVVVVSEPDYRATARAMVGEIVVEAAETAVSADTPTPQPTATETAPTATAVTGIVARAIEQMVATPTPAVYEQPPAPPTPEIIRAAGLPDSLPYSQQEQWQCKALQIIGSLEHLQEPQRGNCETYLEEK